MQISGPRHGDKAGPVWRWLVEANQRVIFSLEEEGWQQAKVRGGVCTVLPSRVGFAKRQLWPLQYPLNKYVLVPRFPLCERFRCQ